MVILVEKLKRREMFMSWNQRVSQRIKDIVDEKQISQKEIVEKSEKIRMPIKQGTLSKLLNGKQMLTVEYLEMFSKVLEVPVEMFFEKEETNIFFRRDTEGFVVDVKQGIYKGYLGKYYLYFYAPAITERGKILKGELELKEYEGVCRAKMELFVGKLGESNNNSKRYSGQMIVSRSLNCAYLTLYEPDLGDFGSMVFRHRIFRLGELQVRLGLALTCSAGDFNLPTAHYILLSREKIEEDKLEMIANIYMRIGNDYCCLSESNFHKLQEEFPDLNLFFSQYREMSKLCYVSDFLQVDKWIQTENMSEEKRISVRNRLAEYSFQGKYNESVDNERECTLFQKIKDNKFWNQEGIN